MLYLSSIVTLYYRQGGESMNSLICFLSFLICISAVCLLPMLIVPMCAVVVTKCVLEL